MARAPTFPPKITTVRGRARCFAVGRYHYLGEPGSEQARAAYAALLAGLGGIPAAPATVAVLTVADVVAAFLRHAKATYSARGRELVQYRSSVRPLLALNRDTEAGTFGPKALRRVQSAMADGSWRTPEQVAADQQRGRPDGWCRGVVNRRVVRLRTLWRWAESEELVPKGSTAALDTVRGLAKNCRTVRHTARREPTSWEDLQAVLVRCAPVVATMLEIQWWSGCRSQDVRLMRFDRIEVGPDAWVYVPEIDKGDWRDDADEAPRAVLLGPECQRLLIGWIEANPETMSGYLFRPTRRRRNPTYTVFSYAQAVRRACVAASVKIIPYGGRHAARMRVGREMSDEAARAYLGQRSINSTQLYGRRDLEHAAEVARRLG